MCGIVGIFNAFGLNENVKDLELFKTMVNTLDHRGPDERGILQSHIAWLGHTRLSIVDLTSGQQPMSSEDKNICIVFNGEIFNFIELRDELITKGYKFKTTSDTEVLVYLYQDLGNEMFGKLNGQFSIGVIDFEKKSLCIARDRIGILPLYYTFSDETIFFSSSIRTLLKHPHVSRSFNMDAYYQMTNIWTTFGDTTFVKDVFSVEPGQYIEITQSGVQKKKYWDLHFPEKPDNFTLDEWKEKLVNTLSNSVKIRLRADVEVNSYLSGGLDSSIILQLIKENHKNNIESFSVRFSDAGFDESSFQSLMTEHTNIKNNFVTVDPEKIGSVFEEVIFFSEQPVYRTAPAPLYYLSKLVNQKGYKVVLSGEGADEISYGYDIFKETLIRYNLAKGNNKEQWLNKVEKLYPYLDQFNKRYLKFLQDFYLKSSTKEDSILFSHQIRIDNAKYLQNFLTPEAKQGIGDYDVEADFRAIIPDGYNKWTPLQKNQFVEMKTLLAGYLLSSQGDRMSMAHSVEARFPFLDNAVVDLFTKMPDEIKLHDFVEKSILKESFKKKLPLQIINRAKQPYRAPESVSLLNKFIEKKYLNPELIKKQNLFNWDSVYKLRNKILSNPDNVTFNDNYAMVNIISTTIFKYNLENNFSEGIPLNNNLKEFKITCYN